MIRFLVLKKKRQILISRIHYIVRITSFETGERGWVQIFETRDISRQNVETISDVNLFNTFHNVISN